MKQDIIKTLKIVSLALVITLGINYIYAWTGPTATPPGNNTATPINAGPVNQVKVTGTGTGNNGGLSLGVLTVQGKSLFQDTIQIAGGTPADGYVLTATDNLGNATWEEAGGSVAPTPAGLVLGGFYYEGSQCSFGSKWGNATSTGNSCGCASGLPELSGYAPNFNNGNTYSTYLCVSQ